MSVGAVCLDQEQNPIDCLDPNCTYGDCVTQAAGATVTPNPTLPNTAQGSSASDLSQMANVMGQWGSTIAGIVTHQPTVVSSQGARTGYAATSPLQSVGMGGNGTILLLLVVAVVVVLLVRD